MENLIKLTVDFQQPEIQVEIDPDLFGKFMQQILIWDYSSVSRESYIAISNFEKREINL